jgi:hypothetical protein
MFHGLTQGDALSPLLFNFPLEYIIRRLHVNQEGLKLNGTHQLLVYACGVNTYISKIVKTKIYRTVILRVVMYGCATWLLILREERRLRMFENRMFRRIFGPNMDEVTGEEKTT